MRSLGSVAIILLAAGESRRMGTRKQLLSIRGKPMVRVAAEVARQVSAEPVIVVVGANGSEIIQALDGLDVRCTVNPEWQEGMGASLRHGMLTLARIAPQAQAVMVLLADQPGIQAGHLSALIELHRRAPGHIVATENRGVTQPPALFPRPWFARLGSLRGDCGARAVLRDVANEIQLVHVDSIDDMDTPEDYDNFIKGSNG